MVNKKKSASKLHDNKECSLSLFSIDDYPERDARCSTPNSGNTNNAYNLKFDSASHNVNNNNRNNGYTVRPVRELTNKSLSEDKVRHFSINREQLLLDLYRAYKDARKNKRNKNYQLKFEYNLEDNLVKLRDELIDGIYKPQPSDCFIIHEPKMREVFAANFRDRIVHHLFYNYTHEIFEKRFIYDSYSCIKNKGTHFGIKRLRHHILSVSKGYSKPCFILKIDIKGYFMNINREKLLEICRNTISKTKNIYLIDYQFVDYLIETIVSYDPLKDCNVLGEIMDWDKLPEEKSLFFTKDNCGLPIGNLSSQLFSNVYLNVFDQYVKRKLKCRHYGRYVDDAYIVSNNREYLKSIIPKISVFLKENLYLEIHPHKTRIYNAYHGIEFLGAFLKPFRTYISTSSLERIVKKIKTCELTDNSKVQNKMNSFLGVLSHYDSYCIRRVVFGNNIRLNKIGYFDNMFLRYKI
ncbi:MAG: RNA-directed DNA polymerase [Bacteroidales bacterium]|nr:RNA-directed DNA polymerase [Bacteroidales bacterium]